jgi:hypothetical protein
MGTAAPPTLRIPLILLAIADLALLGVRLWPWQEVFNLPGSGTTGFDPAISLLAYIGLIFWIAGTRQEETRKALGFGTMLGVLGGLSFVGVAILGAQSTSMDQFQLQHMELGLLAAAAITWGIAGWLGARKAGNAIIGLISGIWSAMVSSLIACTAVLIKSYDSSFPPETLDPWKQYEGLAIGNPAVQALVHSLNTATAFLLIAPLVGGALGLLLGLFGQSQKN